jgi:hypothetical protein
VVGPTDLLVSLGCAERVGTKKSKEISMSYKRIWTITMVFVFAGLMLGQPARANQCKQSDASGKFGFTLTGWLILPTGAVPAAAVGQANIDNKGNVTGTEARSVGGGFADETLTGTLTIEDDCTGSVTLTFSEAGVPVRTSVLSIVLVDDKNEIRMVQKSLTLPNGSTIPVVITADARRIATKD